VQGGAGFTGRLASTGLNSCLTSHEQFSSYFICRIQALHNRRLQIDRATPEQLVLSLEEVNA